MVSYLPAIPGSVYTDKQAQTLLMPVAARRQLNDLPDELWTRISIEFYKDSPDAVFKSLTE
jgi:ATP-dependent Lon protease